MSKSHHARQAAERAAAGYTKTRPVSELLDALRQEWDSEAHDLEWLTDTLPRRDNLHQIAQLRRQLNRPGFDAASFLAKDADHAEEVSRRAAGTCDPDGP